MYSLERRPHPPSPTSRDSPGGSRGGSKTAATSDDVPVDAVRQLFVILQNPSHRFLVTFKALPVITSDAMAWSGAQTILVPSSLMSDHDVALTGSIVSRITSRTALTKSTRLDAASNPFLRYTTSHDLPQRPDLDPCLKRRRRRLWLYPTPLWSHTSLSSSSNLSTPTRTIFYVSYLMERTYFHSQARQINSSRKETVS